MYHILPIISLDEVDKITIVRDTKGPNLDKVKYYCPPTWTLKFPIIALLCKFILMVNLSLKEKPELVHGYLMFPHGILAFIVGMVTRRKVGISFIAGPVELYTLGRSPIGEYPYSKPLPPLNFTGKILLHVLNKCDIITVSGSYTKKFLEGLGIKKGKIFILPHIVDSRFKPIDKVKKYDIVLVGRLAAVKHVEILIKSINLLKSKCKDVNVAIVGDGECKTKLENLTRKLDLTKNIFFVGYQSDVWEWYNKGKISILTSEREGFPYSVIEALSCGLPVISSNCGDVSDVLKQGYNGFVIDNYQDYKNFAESIQKLINSPEMLLKYSNNAMKSVRHLTKENVANAWKTILVSI